MTVLHTGSTKQYSANWQNIFGKGAKKKPPPAAAKQAKPKRGRRKAGK